jgi:hypothetical protein
MLEDTQTSVSLSLFFFYFVPKLSQCLFEGNHKKITDNVLPGKYKTKGRRGINNNKTKQMEQMKIKNQTKNLFPQKTTKNRLPKINKRGCTPKGPPFPLTGMSFSKSSQYKAPAAKTPSS